MKQKIVRNADSVGEVRYSLLRYVLNVGQCSPSGMTTLARGNHCRMRNVFITVKEYDSSTRPNTEWNRGRVVRCEPLSRDFYEIIRSDGDNRNSGNLFMWC